ncbi:STAS domain-containing protein [Nonomuraea sp. NPDC050310]|uniref:STAS domain-containing protein n=1 Tax=Nonomuraea sp. NPDC050310 TaxID=3154935 RepID=UPI0033DBF101
MRLKRRPHLTVQSRNFGPVTVLTLAGDLTEATLTSLSETLAKALSRIPPLVVLDSRQIHTIDRAGGSLLVSAAGHARSSGGQLIGVGVAPSADFEMASSVEKALVAMRRH